MEPVDEVLADERRPALVRTAARRRLLGGLAVLVLAAGLTARVVSDHPSARPSPAPPSPSPLRATPLAAPPSSASGAAAACPDAMPCNVVDVLPRSTVAAVDEHAPGARVLSVHTIGFFLNDPDGGLWYRQVEAVLGGVRIQVVVQRAPSLASAAPTQSSARVAGQVSGIVRTVLDGYAVTVQFTGGLTYQPSMSAIRDLAVDPRLLHLG